MQKDISAKSNTGYTIIETMVAISLFLVVIMYGTTALLNANLLHKKSGNMRSIMDNLSFIMDDISRNLRVGYDYYCFLSTDIAPDEDGSTFAEPRSCANGSGVAFENSNGGNQSDASDQWFYLISNGKVWKVTQGPYTNASYIQITPDEVVINTAASRFTVVGAEAGDGVQPLVIIRLAGTITYNNNPVPFSLQTSVSQRLIDN